MFRSLAILCILRPILAGPSGLPVGHQIVLTCRYLLTHTDLGVAWLFNMVYSIGLVFLATWTVVKLAPEAAGGGVAEVMAYLNGCQLPKAGAFCAVHVDCHVFQMSMGLQSRLTELPLPRVVKTFSSVLTRLGEP